MKKKLKRKLRAQLIAITHMEKKIVVGTLKKKTQMNKIEIYIFISKPVNVVKRFYLPAVICSRVFL